MRRTAWPALGWRAAILGTLATTGVASATTVAAQAQATITVDTTSTVVDFGGGRTVADLPGPDGLTSLPEATIAATNTAGPDTIAFDIPTSDPGFTGTEFVIGIASSSTNEGALTIGDDATTVDATTQPGGFAVVLDGGPGDVVDSGTGLHITSSANTVIGLAVRGYAIGILAAGGSNNQIVGVTATGNLNGVEFAGRTTGVGGEVSGSTIRDNESTGITVVNITDVVVDGNTVIDNGGSGVFVGFSSDRTTVTDNVISRNGIGLHHSGGVGGVVSGNTITDNTGAGFSSNGGQFTRQFTITRNSIANNGELGIDLLGGREDEFGVTPNDAQDRDSGANGLLNFPERMSATDDGTATTVQGRVESPDPQSLTIELYANGAPDRSGHGEGETFLGTATADGRGRFTATLPSGLAGQWLTATATDAAGNTSEFSEAVQVLAPVK